MDPKKLPSLIELCPTYQLQNPAKWTLQGSSKAGNHTGLYLKELKIMFDCGLNTYFGPKAVLLSHYHVDHCQALPFAIHSRTSVKGQEDLMGRPVYMPKDAYQKILDYEKSIMNLCIDNLAKYNFDDDMSIWKHQKLHPKIVEAGQTFTIPGLPDNIEVETHPAYHSATSIGYGLILKKEKLKPEYQNLVQTKEGREKIKELKANNIQITETIKEPQVLFYGDSNIWNLTKHSEWKKYPVIICECTSYPEIREHPDFKRTGTEQCHTHLPDLLQVIKANKDHQWILIHSSMAINSEELERIEKKLRQKEGLNLTILK